MKLLHNDRGLTLIETLAALTIFAVITVGITPLLASSLRGSTLSRSYTVGKDLALEGMERARSLPYFVAHQSQPKKVDALDIYFPCADTTLAVSGCGGEGTRSYAAGVFTITCAATTTPGPTCAVPIPGGYSIRYEARFVRGDGSTTVLPPTSPMYRRDPLPTEGQLDIPPSQLMEVAVTATWSISGTARSFTLRTLLGDRKFGEVKMAGVARINYAAQVQTSYVHTSGDTRTSDLKAIAGISESRIESRLVSNADQRVRAAEITLVRRPSDVDPESAPLGGTPLTGALGEFRAPPTQTPTVTASPNPGVTVTHPNLALDPQIAFMNTTTATGLSVTAANELPAATGRFGMAPQTDPIASALGYFWVQNQADTADTAVLHLDPTKKMFSLKSAGESGATAAGETSVTSTAIGAGRKVEARAVLQNPGIKLLRALPVTFVPGNEHERHIVIIKDFTASVTCTSVGGPGSSAIGLWSATIQVWRDRFPTNDVSLPTEMEAINIPVDGTLATTHTNLRTILARPAPDGIGEANPLIYDGLTSATDVYLFKEGGLNGYLTDFTISSVASGVDAATSSIATAGIEGAIQVTTVPTNPLLPESGLSISVGSLNCQALDRR